MRLREYVLLGALCIIPIVPCSAERVKDKMIEAYSAFRALQPYLNDASKFQDAKNDMLIKKQLSSLNQTFHRLESIDSKYHDEPGFVPTLKLVNDMLDDVTTRLSEHTKVYTFWRLRTLSNHCVTCHVTYNAKLFFDAKDKSLAGLSHSQQADFYLSTRQFKKATTYYLAALQGNQTDQSAIEVLKRWLVVETRVSPDPRGAYTTLKRLLPNLKLSPFEKEEANSWLLSLKAWSEDHVATNSVTDVEKLFHRTLPGDLYRQEMDAVSILRGTVALHRLIEQRKISGPERARALFLLGFGYNKIRSFLINELPEMYLELCIEEAIGSEEAKSAFRLYQEIVTESFTGSGGTHLPSEVKLKLMELYNKAHGIPEFVGKV